MSITQRDSAIEDTFKVPIRFDYEVQLENYAASRNSVVKPEVASIRKRDLTIYILKGNFYNGCPAHCRTTKE